MHMFLGWVPLWRQVLLFSNILLVSMGCGLFFMLLLCGLFSLLPTFSPKFLSGWVFDILVPVLGFAVAVVVLVSFAYFDTDFCTKLVPVFIKPGSTLFDRYQNGRSPGSFVV